TATARTTASVCRSAASSSGPSTSACRSPSEQDRNRNRVSEREAMMERNGAVTTTGVSGLAGLAVIALLLCAAPAAAQPLEGADRWADSVRVEIHAALVRGDVEALVAAGALAERALAAFPGDPLL